MPFQWWKERNIQNLTGLDIGSDSIQLLKINTALNPPQVEIYAATSLPKNAVEKGEIKNPAAISEALKQLLLNVQKPVKWVTFAVSRASVIIKNVTIDRRLNTHDIESRAWVEANRHFPDLVGEIYLDFNVTPSAEDPSSLDLMLIVCRKDQIEPYINVIKEAGLTPEIIDVNCYALETALSFVTDNFSSLQTVALLNLESNLSSLIVVHEGNLIFAHDYTYDGSGFNSQIEEYIKSGASVNAPEYMQILQNGLSMHLRHSMHFFYSSRTHTNIQKIFITGHFSKIPNIISFIKQEVGIEACLANPFEKMTVAADIDATQLQKNSSALILSCGLALRSNYSFIKKDAINLLPWREQKRRKKKRDFFMTLGICFGCSLLFMLFVHLLITSLINTENNRVQYLQTVLGQKQADFFRLKEQKKKQVEVEKELSYIMNLRKQNFQVVNLLNELVKVVPESVTLTKLIRSGDKITVEGRSESETPIMQLIKNITHSSVFNQPVLTHMNAPSSTTEKATTFQLEVKQKDHLLT